MTTRRSERLLTLREREEAAGIGKQHHNARIEKAVLGSILISPSALDECLSRGVTRDHFYGYREQIAFLACCRLADTLAPVDFITLEHEIREMGLIADCSPDFLQEMFDVIPTAANISHYVTRLIEMMDRRKRELDAVEGLRLLRDGDEEGASARFQAAMEGSSEATPLLSREAQMRALKAAMDTERAGGIVGMPTGFAELDNAIGGFVRGRSYAVAGRTSEGKTALAMQMALNVAEHHDAVHVFSKEMAHVDLNRRLLALISGVSLPPNAAMRLTPAQEESIEHAHRYLAGVPLTVDDRALDLAATMAEARRLKGRVGLFVIDHARLMEVRGADTEYESVTRVSSACKRIALDCNAAVILVCQINREGAKSGTPQIHHIQSTGAIGQDSDGVLLIVRNDYGKLQQSGPPDRSATLAVLKNRHGTQPSIPLEWQPRLARFVESEVPRES